MPVVPFKYETIRIPEAKNMRYGKSAELDPFGLRNIFNAGSFKYVNLTFSGKIC